MGPEAQFAKSGPFHFSDLEPGKCTATGAVKLFDTTLDRHYRSGSVDACFIELHERVESPSFEAEPRVKSYNRYSSCTATSFRSNGSSGDKSHGSLTRCCSSPNLSLQGLPEGEMSLDDTLYFANALDHRENCCEKTAAQVGDFWATLAYTLMRVWRCLLWLLSCGKHGQDSKRPPQRTSSISCAGGQEATSDVILLQTVNSREMRLSVLLLGASGAGKTRLLLYLRFHTHVSTVPTMGLYYETLSLGKRDAVVVEMRELPRPEAVLKFSCVIYLVQRDWLDLDSLDHALGELTQILQVKAVKTPVVIVLTRVGDSVGFTEHHTLIKFFSRWLSYLNSKDLTLELKESQRGQPHQFRLKSSGSRQGICKQRQLYIYDLSLEDHGSGDPERLECLLQFLERLL